MKKIIYLVIGIAVIIVLGIVGLNCFVMVSESNENYYYAQIDNNKLTENNSNGSVIDFNGQMKYLYTLQAYDQNGKSKDITFGVSRELTEGAFIRLTVMPIRGVTEWNEIKYNDLPATVQDKFSAPNNE